jgi:hypothetical protein
VIPRHPLADTGDIFSSIDRVSQNITECIKLAETTLQRSESKELEVSTTIFDHDLDDFIDALDELPPPGLNSIRSEATCTKPLSELEEDLDYLLQHREGEATVQREAPLFDNSSRPLLSGCQGPIVASTQSGRLMRQKGTKPLELFDIGFPLYDIDSDELPFQEGRPLNPSDREDEQPAKNSTLDHELFMAFIKEIQDVEEEGSE